MILKPNYLHMSHYELGLQHMHLVGSRKEKEGHDSVHLSHFQTKVLFLHASLVLLFP